MSFRKDFKLGYKSYGKAFNILFSNGLWWFFAFPLVIYVIMFFAGSELKSMASDYVRDGLMNWTELNEADFYMADVLATVVSGAITVLFTIAFYFIFAYFGGYIVLIVMSPALAYLSEKTEKILTGNEYSIDPMQLIRDIVRGILIVFRNLTIEIGIMLGVFTLGFIPVIGWFFSFIGGIFVFFVSAYFYGFSFMEYSNERRKLSVRKSVKMIRSRKGVAVGNGLIFSIFLLIPFCGVPLAGFTAIVSAVAASIAMVEISDKEKGAAEHRNQILPKDNLAIDESN